MTHAFIVIMTLSWWSWPGFTSNVFSAVSHSLFDRWI